MSRARVHEVSSPISLFPFIGILLCTMGALLVILVAVSRSARDTATAEVEAKQKAAPVDHVLVAKIDYVKGYVGKLTKVRSEAEKKLREQHQHLSNLEDHINRMHERMRSLQAAAKELDSLEREHYDDRSQAERETVRLNQLIQEAHESIASMQESAEKAPSSYAVVPYEGPNGTYRRPIYIECVKDGVILQPEGVVIAGQDLLPPYGAGNPLASTLRATRDHLIKLYPKEGQTRNLEPYPLLLVRSEGLIMYDRARQAIEAGDFDLGFELVEDNWKLKFPAPDPQLASRQQQALVQARARQEVLAAAAPRAYRDQLMDDSQTGADDGDSGDTSFAAGGESGAAMQGGPGLGGSGGSRSPVVGSSGSYAGGPGGGGSSGSYGSIGNRGAGSTASSGGMSAGGGTGGSSNPSTEWHGGQGATSAGGMGTMSASAAPAGAAGTDAGGMGADGSSMGGGMGGNGNPGAGGMGVTAGGSSPGSVGGLPMSTSDDPHAPPDPNAQRNVNMQFGAPPPDAANVAQDDPRRGKMPPNLAESRGKDWALRQKAKTATPVRRTIRVVVQDDKLLILPDNATGSANAIQGKVVPLEGDTVQSMDGFVKQIREHIDNWGIAGNGLYWRPVILLSVAPQGQRRASDLERLLKNSGLELRTDETASNAPPRKMQ